MAGRPKGSISKKTMMLEEKLKKYDMDPIAGLFGCLEELESVVCLLAYDKILAIQAKANIWVDLMSYIYPKRKALDITHQVNEDKHIVWDLRYGDDDSNIIVAETNAASKANTAIQEKI